MPALLYLIDNNVFFLVMKLINPSTFQLMSNIKIVFVAVLCRVVLHKYLNRVQHASLVLLVVGLVVSELDSLVPASSGAPAAAAPSVPLGGAFGYVALMSFCSASGNVFIEHLYKRPGHNLYWQNLTLYTLGVVLNVMCVFVYHGDTVRTHGIFVGFDFLTWLIITCSACSGLAVAFVLKHADNLGNVWAHAAALVVTALASAALFAFPLTPSFICGGLIVTLCAYIYHVGADKVEFPPRATIAYVGDDRVELMFASWSCLDLSVV